MIRKNQIWKIYGDNYKEMTKELLVRTDLEACIREKRKRAAGTSGKSSAEAKDTGADKSLCIGIKPNLVCPVPADFGATTHPEIVAGIIEYLQERGYRNLKVVEGSWVGDRTSDAYELCGYRQLCEQYGVPFVDAQRERWHTADCAGMELQITEIADSLDFLINVPVLKGHCQTKVTCALKNLKGLLPNAEKRHFHTMGLHRPIAHLNAALCQDFIVTDHICGDPDFEEGGNPVVRGCIMAALDPVLTDSYACYLLGYTPDEVPYVRLAEQLGVGSADLRKAQIVAAAWKKKRTEKEMEETVWNSVTEEEKPLQHRYLDVSYAVEDVDSCSACYGNLVPALYRLQEEGLLEKLQERIAIGQGQQGKTGRLGVGRCAKGFDTCIAGCPPDEERIYEELKAYIQSNAPR